MGVLKPYPTSLIQSVNLQLMEETCSYILPYLILFVLDLKTISFMPFALHNKQ